MGKYIAKEGGYVVTGVSDAKSALLICRGDVRPRNRFFQQPKYKQTKTASDNADSTSTVGQTPDCAVLDIRLNGDMDGLELLKVIRSDSTLQSLPVVLLTARGRVEDRIAGYDADADAYLSKPFDSEELISVIDSVVKRGRVGRGGNNNLVEGGGGLITSQDLMHELAEIKSLIKDMGMVVGETPDRMSSDMKDDDRISASSIHKELLSIKESIKNKTSTIAVTTEDVMEQRNATSPLTIEEVAVLNLLDQGLTNQEIATQMESSTEEVSQKMNSLMQKTNVTSRTDLVRWWKDTRLYETTKLIHTL